MQTLWIPPLHFPDLQSRPVLHFWPMSHAVQSPPQSMSLSVASKRWSAQWSVMQVNEFRSHAEDAQS